MLPTLVLNAKIAPCPAAVDDDVALAYVRENPHAATRVLGVQAHYDLAVSAVKAITMKYADALGDSALEDTGLARGSTDTAVASNAFHYGVGGVAYRKAAVATGTALAAGTIPADTWGIYRLMINVAGTILVVAGDTNFTTGYGTEADAIADLPGLTDGYADMGYLTVLTASGQAFIGGTDALQGGSSGNPSDDTNYYAVAPTWTTLGIAMPWDFTNGPFIGPLPGIANVPHNKAFVMTLAASGTPGTSGSIAAWLVAP